MGIEANVSHAGELIVAPRIPLETVHRFCIHSVTHGKQVSIESAAKQSLPLNIEIASSFHSWQWEGNDNSLL